VAVLCLQPATTAVLPAMVRPAYTVPPASLGPSLRMESVSVNVHPATMKKLPSVKVSEL